MFELNVRRIALLAVVCALGPSSVYAQYNASGITSETGQAPLNLTCKVAGAMLRDESSTATIASSNPAFDGATIESDRAVQQGFSGQIDLRLFDGNDRIRLPNVVIPVVHGGDKGWFKIKNLKVSDREITGQAAVNFVSNPPFRIDRLTGEIEISGRRSHFSGQCRKLDPEKDKALF